MRALSRGDSGEEDPDRVGAGTRRSDAGGHLDEAWRPKDVADVLQVWHIKHDSSLESFRRVNAKQTKKAVEDLVMADPSDEGKGKSQNKGS